MLELRGFDFFSLCSVAGIEFSDVVSVIERWSDYVSQMPESDENQDQVGVFQDAEEGAGLSTKEGNQVEVAEYSHNGSLIHDNEPNESVPNSSPGEGQGRNVTTGRSRENPSRARERRNDRG